MLTETVKTGDPYTYVQAAGNYSALGCFMHLSNNNDWIVAHKWITGTPRPTTWVRLTSTSASWASPSSCPTCWRAPLRIVDLIENRKACQAGAMAEMS